MAIFKPFGKKYLREQINDSLVSNLEVIKYKGRIMPEQAITEWLKGKTLIGRMGTNLYVCVRTISEVVWYPITGLNYFDKKFSVSWILNFSRVMTTPEYVWLLKCIEEDFDQTWIINNVSDLSEIFLGKDKNPF